MQSFKADNNVLLVLLLSFYVSQATGSDYVPFSYSEVAETSTIIPTIISENSSVALVASAAALLGGTFYLGKDKISTWADNKYKDVAKNIEIECQNKLGSFEESSWKNKALLYALAPFRAEAKEYWEYNKWHMGVAAVLMCMGKLAGHPYLAGNCGGIVLAKGWCDQGLAAVKKTIEEIKRNIEALRLENITLHEKTQMTVEDIRKDVTTILSDLETTKQVITHQMTNMEEKLSTDVANVGNEIIAVSKTLNGFAQQILEVDNKIEYVGIELLGLRKDNEIIITKNDEIVAKVDGITQELHKACSDFVSVSAKFDGLKKDLSKMCQNVTDVNKEQIDQINIKIGMQNDKFEELKSEMTKTTQECFQKVAQQNLLLESINTMQSEQGKQFTQLLSRITQQEQDYESINSITAKLVKAEEDRAVKNAEFVSSLQTMCEANKNTVVVCCTSMEQLEQKMNAKMDALSQKVDEHEAERKKDNNLILVKVVNNEGLIVNLRTSVHLQGQQIVFLEKQTKRLLKKIKKLKDEIKLVSTTTSENLQRTKDIQQDIRGAKVGVSQVLSITDGINPRMQDGSSSCMNVYGRNKSSIALPGQTNFNQVALFMLTSMIRLTQ